MLLRCGFSLGQDLEFIFERSACGPVLKCDFEKASGVTVCSMPLTNDSRAFTERVHPSPNIVNWLNESDYHGNITSLYWLSTAEQACSVIHQR